MFQHMRLPDTSCPHCATTYLLKEWNTLPPSIVTSHLLNSFKHNIIKSVIKSNEPPCALALMSIADFASRIQTCISGSINKLVLHIQGFKNGNGPRGLCFEIKISQMMYTHQLFYCLLC